VWQPILERKARTAGGSGEDLAKDAAFGVRVRDSRKVAHLLVFELEDEPHHAVHVHSVSQGQHSAKLEFARARHARRRTAAKLKTIQISSAYIQVHVASHPFIEKLATAL
jgi:hypothetical protein